MKILTVFTPAYNRAYCLDRLYKSLCEQTCKDFIWLIVDDGSIDNTRQLVESWITENTIEIRYFYKINGGMHTAHNLAYQLIDTEINTCIDSDDYMPLDAVASIIECWNGVKNDHTVAGIVGLDEDPSGNLIGTRLPVDGTRSKLGALYNKHKVSGDKKLVYRSCITRVYPAYPEYSDEKLVPLGRLYILIDRDYSIVCFNKVWVTVDYQLNGSSNTIFSQYFQSPKGFRDARVTNIKYGIGFFFRLKNIIHLGICNLILKETNLITQSPSPVASLLLLPFSLVLFIYLKQKIRDK